MITSFHVDTGDVRSFDDFVRAFNVGFCEHLGGSWRGNLDAFDDYLSWPEGAFALSISDAARCAEALGYSETMRVVETLLHSVHFREIAGIKASIARAERHEGPTLWDSILSIFSENTQVRLNLGFDDRQLFMRGTTIIELRNEPLHTPGSADNERRYERELVLDAESLTSKHGLRLGSPDSRSVLLAAGGGCSAVTSSSLILFESQCIIGIGDSSVCCSLPHLEPVWSSRADLATVFGLHTRTSRFAL